MRSEVGGLSNGILGGLSKYHEVTLGVIQLGLEKLALPNGYCVDEEIIDTKLARRHIHIEDLDDLVADCCWFMHREIMSRTPNTYLEYPFQYKMQHNLFLFVGIDVRDMR